MRASTIFAGFVGGVALAASLAAPLYVGLPGRYLPQWAYMTVEGSMWGFLGAMVVIIGAGYFAARLDPEAPVSSGTLAGTLAAIVGGLLMALPATAMEAVSPVITFIELGGDGRLEEVAAEAMVTAMWLPGVAGAVLLGAGPAFGAMGGVGFDLTEGTTSGTARPVAWSPVPMAGLVSGVLWVALISVAQGRIDTVWANAELVMTQVDTVKQSVPVAMVALFASVLLAWAVRDSVLLYRGGRRLRGALWGSASLGVGLVLLAEAMVLVPTTRESPLLWIVVAGGGLALLVVFIRAARTDSFLDLNPWTVGDLMSQGLLVGLAVLGQALFAIGSAVIAVGVVVLPWLAQSDVAPAASELLVSRVFQIHWVAGVGLIVLALIWVIVATPVWLLGRAVRRG